MPLEITAQTAFALYLQVTFNGQETPDCVAINLETNEGTFLNRGVDGGRAPSNEPGMIKLKGEFRLGLMPRLPSAGRYTPDYIIEEMRQSVLFDAMSEEEKRVRAKNIMSAEPLPRDAELKQIFDRLFANYRAGLNAPPTTNHHIGETRCDSTPC